MLKKLLIVIIMCLLCTVVACSNSSNQSSIESAFNFNTKAALLEKEDGWLYHLSYQLVNNSDQSSYHFGGYNFKHKYLEGYDIPVIEKETGEVIDTVKSSLPYLSLSEELGPELDKINNYFNEKKFINPIEMSDLDELKIRKINKQEVLQLFNEAISKEEFPNGDYINLPAADIILEERKISGYQWQTGYYIIQGNIAYIRIELIYEDNTYLSDLINENKADKDQISIYKVIKEIEKGIIDNQCFVVSESKELVIANIKFQRLSNLLQKLDFGGKRND